MVGVEAGDEPVRIVLEEFGGVPLVDFHPGAEHAGIHVVGPLFNDGAPLDPLDQLFDVFDRKDDDFLDLDVFFEQIRLAEGAGDAVEEEELLRGEIAVGGDQAMDEVMPDLDRHFVGEKEPFSGVVVVELAGGRFRGEAPENVPGGEVAMVARRAEEFAQGALPGPGGAEDQDRPERLGMAGNHRFCLHRCAA